MNKLFEKKILVCCGTGGVGKTTTSAAIAMQAAIEGKNVALITIDPAKRLATSLGLENLRNEPQDLTAFLEKSLKIKAKGTLCALMLDAQDTFYHFLEIIGGPAVREAFRASELFEVIAGNFGGTHDYLAME